MEKGQLLIGFFIKQNQFVWVLWKLLQRCLLLFNLFQKKKEKEKKKVLKERLLFIIIIVDYAKSTKA